jgi:hypothetical protein
MARGAEKQAARRPATTPRRRRAAPTPPPASTADPKENPAMSAATSMVGLTTAVVMYVSQYADPVVCGIVFGAPTAVVLALGRLAKKAKGVIPPETHNHYEGPVYQDQREQHSKTTGLWAKTNNEQ